MAPISLIGMILAFMWCWRGVESLPSRRGLYRFAGSMKRSDALRAIEGAGASGDQAALMRIYVEHRISYPVAIEAYRKGVRFAAFIAARDS